MEHDFVLWIVVGTALAFDFTNGFHDTANAVATSISTRAFPGPDHTYGMAPEELARFNEQLRDRQRA